MILGVAFVSGTFVLTQTITNTFNGLFSDIYEHTDAVVRAKQEFSGQGFGDAGRGTISADLLPAVARMWPATKPYQPTVHDLHQNGRLFPPNYLHESWMDYLYWDSELEE